jgi:hypothetical protein
VAWLNYILEYEKFEETKGIIRRRINSIQLPKEK